jgi:hypothetical protein
MEKEKKKKDLKSYILWVKLTTYGRVAYKHYINFGPK